jgi:hypothetical protein
MHEHISRSLFHFRRGQKLVISFYLCLVVSGIAWVSVWGPKGTTLAERFSGKGAGAFITYIPLVPSLACLLTLLALQGVVNNTPLQVRLPKDRDLDELQLTEKNIAYQKAYIPVCTFFLICTGYIALSSALGLPLPTSLGVGWGIFMLAFLVSASSPLVILTWRQK